MGTDKQQAALDKKQANFVRDVYDGGPTDEELKAFKKILQSKKKGQGD